MVASTLRFGIAAIAMALALWILGYHGGSCALVGILALAGAMCAAGIVYVVVLWLVGGLGPIERATIMYVETGGVGCTEAVVMLSTCDWSALLRRFNKRCPGISNKSPRV